MSITVRFLATLKSVIGKFEIKTEVPTPIALSDFIQHLIREGYKLEDVIVNKDLSLIESTIILVNDLEIGALDGLDTIIKDGDTVAFIPIVHGG